MKRHLLKIVYVYIELDIYYIKTPKKLSKHESGISEKVIFLFNFPMDGKSFQRSFLGGKEYKWAKGQPTRAFLFL